MSLESLLSLVAILGSAFAVWRMLAQLDKTLSRDIRDAAAARLKRVKDAAPTNTWAQHFCAVFDAVFGEKHLSLNCFIRSTLASFAACSILFFVWVALRPAEFYRLTTNADLAATATFVVFLLAANSVPDYVSLLKTRLLLGAAAKRSSAWRPFLYLLVDVVVTFVIAIVAFVAFFQIGAMGVFINFCLIFLAGIVIVTCFGVGIMGALAASAIFWFVSSTLLERVPLVRKREQQEGCASFLPGCALTVIFFGIAVPWTAHWGKAFGIWLVSLVDLSQYGDAWMASVLSSAGFIGLKGDFGLWAILLIGLFFSAFLIIVFILLFTWIHGRTPNLRDGALKDIRSLIFPALIALVASLSFVPNFGSNILPVHVNPMGVDSNDPFVATLQQRLITALELKAERPGTVSAGIFLYSTFLTSAWAAASLVGEYVVRGWIAIRRGTSRFLGWVDLEDNPFGSLGFAAAILMVAAWLGYHGANACLSPTASEPAPTGFREWTDHTGTFSTQARFIGVRSEEVVLENQNGELVVIPIESLSDPDVTIVRQHQHQNDTRPR